VSISTSGQLRLGANVWADLEQTATSQSSLSHPYVERRCTAYRTGSDQIQMSDAYGTVCSIQEIGVQTGSGGGGRTHYSGRATRFQSIVIDDWYSRLNSNNELECYLSRTGTYGNDCAIINSFYGYLDGPTGSTVNVSVKCAADGSFFASNQEIRIEVVGFTNGKESGTPKYYLSQAMGGNGYSTVNAFDRPANNYSFTIDNSYRYLLINLTNIVNWSSSSSDRSRTVRWADLRVEIQ